MLGARVCVRCRGRIQPHVHRPRQEEGAWRHRSDVGGSSWVESDDGVRIRPVRRSARDHCAVVVEARREDRGAALEEADGQREAQDGGEGDAALARHDQSDDGSPAKDVDARVVSARSRGRFGGCFAGVGGLRPVVHGSVVGEPPPRRNAAAVPARPTGRAAASVIRGRRRSRRCG